MKTDLPRSLTVLVLIGLITVGWISETAANGSDADDFGAGLAYNARKLK